jgi:alkylation response protein AidB-like acyl-CoA dehydrogenase
MFMTLAPDKTPVELENEQFRQEFRQWLSENFTAEFRENPRWSFEKKFALRRAWQKKLFEAGWIGVSWPKEYGGRGGTTLQEAIYNEELARVGAPIFANRVGIGMLGPTILALGTPEQKARYLPKLLSAEEIWCQGFSEPNAGSDVAALQTRAVIEDGHFIINGQKVWTTYGFASDFCLLLVRTDFNAPNHKALSYVIVDMKSPGVTARPLVQMTGEGEFSEMFFDNVKVPVENLMGELNKGWMGAITTLMHERATNAFSVIMRFEEQLNAFLNLAKNLEYNGQAAVKDPLFRQRLAQMYIDTKLFKLNTMRQNAASGERKVPGPEGSLLKLHWSELGVRITELALEMEGPYSALNVYSEEAPDGGRWQHAFLAARGSTIAAGTTEVQRNIVAQRVLGLPHY